MEGIHEIERGILSNHVSKTSLWVFLDFSAQQGKSHESPRKAVVKVPKYYWAGQIEEKHTSLASRTQFHLIQWFGPRLGRPPPTFVSTKLHPWSQSHVYQTTGELYLTLYEAVAHLVSPLAPLACRPCVFCGFCGSGFRKLWTGLDYLKFRVFFSTCFLYRFFSFRFSPFFLCSFIYYCLPFLSFFPSFLKYTQTFFKCT